MNNVIDLTTPILQKPKAAAKLLGVSEHWLREGLRAGKVPHMRSGKDFLVNIPATIAWINAESEASANGEQI